MDNESMHALYRNTFNEAIFICKLLRSVPSFSTEPKAMTTTVHCVTYAKLYWRKTERKTLRS